MKLSPEELLIGVLDGLHRLPKRYNPVAISEGVFGGEEVVYFGQRLERVFERVVV